MTGSISSSRNSNSNSSNVYKLIMTIIILGSAIISINQIFSNPKINLIALPKVYASEGIDTPSNTTDYISDLFIFGSGLFAAILCALSLNAYKNIRTKRLLIVSIAFGIFSIHASGTSRTRSYWTSRNSRSTGTSRE